MMMFNKPLNVFIQPGSTNGTEVEILWVGC